MSSEHPLTRELHDLRGRAISSLGRYLIIRFIARGGAAEVYEAEDQELRQNVSL